MEIVARFIPTSAPANVSIPAGRESEKSDEQPANAQSSIDESSESDSNATVERAWQYLKQLLQSVRRLAGRQIDERE
jgi:hypothetical protein